MTPTPEQERAIQAIVEWYTTSQQQEFLLDGEAGTGKSTTAAFAVDRLKELPARNRVTRVSSAAYSAKAAKVMRDKGVKGAQTIHSLIYNLEQERVVVDRRGREGYALDWSLKEESSVCDADLVVIDEVSMVNEEVAADLRSFGKKILVLGDVEGQLPPIEGGGAFTSREPDFRLLELNRFALESPIVRLAARIRRGLYIPIKKVGDVEILANTEEAWERIHRPDTQVICGVHRNRHRATREIRARLGAEGDLPCSGEKLICCRNNSEHRVYNGAFASCHGKIETYGEGEHIFFERISMEDERVLESVYAAGYLFGQHYGLERRRPKPQWGRLEFDWGYAITCHKAQGSEWPHVTILDDSYVFYHTGGKDLARRWLYTAVTRASQGLTLILNRKG